MRTLLIVDSLRGEDSTGVATIRKWNAEVTVAKQVGDPFQLFDHKSFDKAFIGIQRAIIGHNRYATMGGVSRQTAHPFENSSVVGAHNGTLRTKHLLADAKNFTVDSENIYHHIDKHGLHDALQFMDGAWALVWWDKKRESINFLRNKERTLYLAWGDQGKQLFWASEAWMLHAAFLKHHIHAGEIVPLVEDVHLEFTVDKNGILGKPVATQAPATYKPPVYKAPAVQHGGTAGKVIDMNKKEDSANAAVKKQTENALPYDLTCLNRKGVEFETLGKGRDQHGAEFVICFDPSREYEEFRLYANPGSRVWDCIGCNILGDVMGWNAAGRTPGKGCYRIDVNTYKVIVPPVDEPEETIVGPTGKIMNKKEFETNYPSCTWCTGNLVFGDNNRFTTGGECLCPSCVKDTEVTQYVNIH